VSKPDPGHLTGVIALAGGDPSRAVMVGDSETDLATAKAAGVPAILVRFGYATSPLNGSGGGDRSFRRVPARAHALLNGLPAGRARL
jgi:phosphoglycolate phosphatase-like HAD superfamily hydrolase